ncbi:MAG: methyltransferase [Rhodospirillales bacterium]|nr:methyltransferase [Rhodospirillales bacterium]
MVPFRQRVGQAAEGRILEIGIGPGLNLPFYGPNVSAVIGIDPSPELLAMAARRRAALPPPTLQVELIEGSSEALPLDDGSIDTVVTTWTLCTIPGAARALGEMRRVLKPGGQLLFVEHGRAPDPGVVRWQDGLTPVWKHFTGGCHLNRKIDALIGDSGFTISTLHNEYLPGPRPMTYMYEGRATPR